MPMGNPETELKKLTTAEVLYFKSLFVPGSYQPLMKSFLKEEGSFWGCFYRGEPGGLFYVKDTMKTVWFLSYLYVSEPYRKRGIGTKMIRFLSDRAQSISSQIYTLINESADEFESIRGLLEKNDWRVTGYTRDWFFLMIHPADRNRLLESWRNTFGDRVHLSRLFTSAPLNALQSHHYYHLIEERGEGYPEGFFPFEAFGSFEALKSDTSPSTFVFREGFPVGWIVFRRYGRQIYVIDQLYIRPEYRIKNLFLPIVYESVRKIDPEIRSLRFYVNGSNEKMQSLLRIITDIPVRRERLIEYVKEAEGAYANL